MLGSGLAGAAVFYWVKVRAADLLLDDTSALGYQRSIERGMGQMMGPLGLVLTEWQHTLTTPLAEALMIAAGAALLAGYFFRVAWVLDAEQEERTE